jgi:hypothetical protein
VLSLSLDDGIDVPMRRPSADFGDRTYPTVPTNPAMRVARKLNPPRRITTDAGGEAWFQDGLLYVYRSTDVRDGDKVDLPEGSFIVTGPAQNDMLNPLDGNDFGVKRFTIERG